MTEQLKTKDIISTEQNKIKMNMFYLPWTTRDDKSFFQSSKILKDAFLTIHQIW